MNLQQIVCVGPVPNPTRTVRVELGVSSGSRQEIVKRHGNLRVEKDPHKSPLRRTARGQERFVRHGAVVSHARRKSNEANASLLCRQSKLAAMADRREILSHGSERRGSIASAQCSRCCSYRRRNSPGCRARALSRGLAHMPTARTVPNSDSARGKKQRLQRPCFALRAPLSAARARRRRAKQARPLKGHLRK